MDTLKTNEDKDTGKADVIVRNILRNKLVWWSTDKAISIDAARVQLSEFMGVTKNQITYWERNTSQPDLADALRIAEFFEVDVKKIFITYKQ